MDHTKTSPAAAVGKAPPIGLFKPPPMARTVSSRNTDASKRTNTAAKRSLETVPTASMPSSGNADENESEAGISDMKSAAKRRRILGATPGEQAMLFYRSSQGCGGQHEDTGAKCRRADNNPHRKPGTQQAQQAETDAPHHLPKPPSPTRRLFSKTSRRPQRKAAPSTAHREVISISSSPRKEAAPVIAHRQVAAHTPTPMQAEAASNGRHLDQYTCATGGTFQSLIQAGFYLGQSGSRSMFKASGSRWQIKVPEAEYQALKVHNQVLMAECLALRANLQNARGQLDRAMGVSGKMNSELMQGLKH
ncbi:hypothetical protein B0T10DRAFT_461051 [Thelonectria olida]|uniref:Uncharacterized protein n=1 Tax=Thelonectria olida TaxID=1576542 RepID=A0A9P8W1Y5_9HYPO|nr:hypothetical protein B0T10DRAFT_461051 [Thelonectria olida]